MSESIGRSEQRAFLAGVEAAANGLFPPVRDGCTAAFYDVSDPVRTDGLTDEQWFAIEGQEDSFLVRAYGPGTWDRVHETPID